MYREDGQNEKREDENRFPVIIPQEKAALMDITPIDATKLVHAFLSGRNKNTLAAYKADLNKFCIFVGVDTLDEAAKMLLESHARGNLLAYEYRAHMIERGLAPKTINRALAAMRQMVRVANLLGIVNWKLEVQSVRAEAYRDTRGPGFEGYRKALEYCEERGGKIGKRNAAIIRLLYDVALRLGEVANLDLEDLDIMGKRIWIIGKGRKEKEPVTLPDGTMGTLLDWIEERGTHPGALFINYDNKMINNNSLQDRRLGYRSIHRLVTQIGKKIGMKVKPHGLRHAAITEALNRTGGDVRKVMKFARHKDVNTTLLYDDNRKDFGGEIADMIIEDEDNDDCKDG